jgi:D-alanyl-D-alanine dipeptidase
MRHAGFHGIHSEWWHFDFGDRDVVRRELPRVL